MNLTRKLVMGCAALLLPVATVTIAGVQAASAGVPPVTGTGTVSCSGATGLMKFNPDLTLTGSSPEMVSVKVVLHGCHASAGSNVTTANFNGKGKGTISASSNNCNNLAGTQTVSGSVAIKWTGKSGTAKLDPTTITLTSITGLAAGANGNVGFTISNQATSGSFAGTTSGELDSNKTAAMEGATCGAKRGLKLLNIVSGHTSQP
jgi:hypothetical protein